MQNHCLVCEPYRAVGCSRTEEAPRSQIPIPGTRLANTAWPKNPVSSHKERARGLSFGTADGWQVCQQDLKHLGRKKEKAPPDVPVTHVAVIWSQPWVTSLYVESYLWTRGALNRAIDAQDGATLRGTVEYNYGKILPGQQVCALMFQAPREQGRESTLARVLSWVS